MSENILPEKYTIPKDRMPKPFSQNVYKNGKLYTTVNSCVTCSIVKVIEVLYAIKNGCYTELSKGYAYVRHSGRGDEGTVPDLVLRSMLEKKKGTVPYDMCSDYTEKPEICNIIETRQDLPELDSIAEKWAIKSWHCVKGNNNKELMENIRKYISTYQVPLIGTLKRSGVNHCVVITGCDDKYVYYHDHTKDAGEDRARYDSWLKHFYYITIPDDDTKGDDSMTDLNKNDKLPFKDVEDDRWSKKYIDKVYKEGDMNGVSEDRFAPDEPLTREQAAALICRLKYGME